MDPKHSVIKGLPCIEKQATVMLINSSPRFPSFLLYLIYGANLGLLLHRTVHMIYVLYYIVSVLYYIPVYEVYGGYIVFVFSVNMFVCVLTFFPSKISQELLDPQSRPLFYCR